MAFLTFIIIAYAMLQIANCYSYQVNYTSLDTSYYDTVLRNETHTFIFTSAPGTLQLSVDLLYSRNYPLFITTQYLDVMQSTSLPIRYESYSLVEFINTTAHTLCVNTAGVHIRVEFESNSLTPVSYSFSLRRVSSKVLQLDTPSFALVSPSGPNFFSYQIVEDYFDIIMTSPSDLCSLVSIQGGECPASDQQIDSQGYYTMTMRTNASLTLRREDFNSNNLIVVLTGAPGKSCDVSIEYSSNQTADNYSKNVSVLVTRSSSPGQYWGGIVFSFFIFLFPYILFGCYYLFEISLNIFSKGHRSRFLFFTIGLPTLPPECLLINSTDPEANFERSEEYLVPKEGSVEPRIIAKYRAKGEKYLYIDHTLKIPSQCTKRRSHLEHKFNSYFYFILVISMFYGIPAIQIAFDQLDLLVTSGNQDLCYYNFRCERRVNSIRAFNNLLSNGAYVTYGILFFIMTCIRHLSYHVHSSKFPLRDLYGVPYFFGVFYAMSVALIAEGVMSTLYHTCPTRANYQFDISFMFIMLTLIMVRLFQQRHPDGNVKAVTTFLLISCVIGLSSIGLWHGETYFYLIRVIYLFFVILFSGVVVISIYYFGMPYMCLVPLYDACMVRRPINQLDINKFLLVFKHNRARFFQIGCFLFANILILVLMFSRDAIPDFPSVILYSFIFNFGLYFLYYWVMKFIKKEFLFRPHVFTASFLLFIFSVFCWVLALAFYFNKVKQWRESASASRERNVECILLEFYDYHDVWHFLSALALFSMYVSIFVIDDNMLFVKRENIHIF